VLVDVSSVSTATTVLGTEVALPILIAPLALQRMAHPDGELATARAAAAAGTIMCLSTAATARPAEVAAAAPGAPRWFQVYVFADRPQTEDLIAEAVESDFSTLLLTVDTPYLGRRERDLRVDFKVPEHLTVSGDIFGGQFDTRVSWRDLEWLAGYDLPIVVKGILTAEDAPLPASTALRNRRLEPAAASWTACPAPSTRSRKSCKRSMAAPKCFSTVAFAAAPTLSKLWLWERAGS
jgi:isopentenyl diphosphate isomerase/L-lactate dehydrogenase-like FMN-dependent dehydrogenase